MKHLLLGPTQEDRVWAGLSYAGAVCCFCGVPSLLIYFLKRGESAYIRFHALQACAYSILWLGIFIIGLTLTVVARMDFALGFFMLLAPGIGWIILMVQTFMGKDPKIPWLSPYLERITAD